MKKLFRTFIPMFVLATLLVSACTAASPVTSGSKVEYAPVEFTGVIESIDGNQWVVGGQTITVDPSVVGDGPFVVGDTVKVKAEVQADGTIVVARVEAPSASDNSNSSNSNDANSNDSNGNDSNSNTTNSNDSGLTAGHSSTEAFGNVDSITVDTVVIGGQTFTITNGSDFKSQIQAGDFVKVHFLLNADGTMTIVEIETWDPALVSNENSNANINDNGNNSNSNGDDSNTNSNDSNSNSNDSNSNSDDHNGNDDNNNSNTNGNGNSG